MFACGNSSLPTEGVPLVLADWAVCDCQTLPMGPSIRRVFYMPIHIHFNRVPDCVE